MIQDKEVPIVLLSEPNGVVAEAYRNLRASLSKQMVQDKRVFTVVSAWMGDGKSMVCTNLATSLSQLHLNVLLIDGDLRRPTISRIFSAHKLTGFTECLEDGKLRRGYKTKIEGLEILPRGLSTANPANLLSTDQLRRAMDYWRSQYDVIVMDTPPLSVCSDAMLLGSLTDGAVMVVSPKGWDGETEVRFQEKLKDYGIPLLGAVLNGALGSELTGRSYGYGYGYGYGNYGYGYGYGGSYGAENSADGESGGQARKRKRSTKPKASPTPRWSFAWPWTRYDNE